jgi:hypothetical protein
MVEEKNLFIHNTYLQLFTHSRADRDVYPASDGRTRHGTPHDATAVSRNSTEKGEYLMIKLPKLATAIALAGALAASVATEASAATYYWGYPGYSSWSYPGYSSWSYPGYSSWGYPGYSYWGYPTYRTYSRGYPYRNVYWW